MKHIFHENRQEKSAGVAKLIFDKINFNTKDIKRDPEGHIIILKRRINQEDINIIPIYVSNIGAT